MTNQQSRNSDEQEYGISRRVNEKENGTKSNQSEKNYIYSSSNIIDIQALKVQNGSSKNQGSNNNSLLLNVSRIVPYQHSLSQNQQLKSSNQQSLQQQQQQLYLQGSNGGNPYYQNGQLQKLQLNSPTKRFTLNPKTLQNMQQKKTQSIGSIQQQHINISSDKNYDNDDALSPTGPRQISVHINLQSQNMESSQNAYKKSLNHIDMEESQDKHDKEYISSNQSANYPGIDKSPQLKQQTKFPPITKGQSSQISQNTSNYKLQKIKITDKETRKNIVALDSISRMDQFTGASNANNSFKIVKQSQQNAYYNQFNKAVQDSNGVVMIGSSLNQIDLDIKSIIPQENPHYYPSYKVKRANPNQKYSRDFYNKDNADTNQLEIVNSKNHQENNNLVASLYNQNQHSAAFYGEERGNKFIDHHGQDDQNDINRSSSTPMLLKKDMKKKLEKIKYHNTIEDTNQENDQQIQQYINRYDKILSAKVNAVPLSQTQIKHVVTIQKKERSRVNLNKFDDSDRESDSQALNPLTQKKYSHNGQNIAKGKQVSSRGVTNLKPIKITKKLNENDLTESQKNYNQNFNQNVIENSSTNFTNKMKDEEDCARLSCNNIKIKQEQNLDDDYQGDDEDTKGLTNNFSKSKQTAQNTKETDFFKVNTQENQISSERAISSMKGIQMQSEQNSFEKTPYMKKKIFQQKLHMTLSTNSSNMNQNNGNTICNKQNVNDLDNILNDSIQKATMNMKQTKDQKQYDNILPNNNIDQALIISNKKKQKKKKKRNTILGTQNVQNANGSTQISNQIQQKNGAVAKNDNIPKEVQKINQYQDFIRAVNFSNKLDVLPIQKPLYKMYVGKASVKQRWWLQLVSNKDQIDQCNIVWTQLRLNEFINDLKPFIDTKLAENTQISSEQKINLKMNDSFTDTNNNNDTSTNIDNSPLLENKLNSSINKDLESQYQSEINNGLDSSDSETEKLRALTARPTVKKSNSLNNSLSNLKTEIKKNSLKDSSINMQPQSKENRSLTPNTRGTIPTNQLKVQLSYNQNTKRLFHPNDFKMLMDIQPSKDYDLRQFFSQSLTDQFTQANKEFYTIEDPNQLKIHNHLENNWNLANKKALFYNLRNYYTSLKQNPFDNIPLTFHIKDGMNDPEYTKFLEHFKQKEEECIQKEKLRLEYKYSADKQKQAIGNQMKKPRNIWIIKPGEITNRGTGITVLNEIDQITQLLAKNDLHANGKPKTYIVQKYLDNPFLYNKRKFDIRCYLLVTVVKGRMKAYWYQDGYIRTSCKEYNCKSLNNKMIHLTNDAVQKKCEDYGKYEPGNKLSYNELQRYLDQNHTEQKVNFQTVIYPRMKQLALDCVKSTFLKMDPQRKEMTFEVFGLDYMIDNEFRTWLIEVNTNPCLELSSPLLARIIPAMIENAFRIAIDPIFGFPPINDWPSNAKKQFIPDSIMENSKFELIFDEAFDGPSLQALFAHNEQQQDIIIEEEEEEEEEIEDEQ